MADTQSKLNKVNDPFVVGGNTAEQDQPTGDEGDW